MAGDVIAPVARLAPLAFRAQGASEEGCDSGDAVKRTVGDFMGPEGK
jgi:hypothetical protein